MDGPPGGLPSAYLQKEYKRTVNEAECFSLSKTFVPATSLHTTARVQPTSDSMDHPSSSAALSKTPSPAGQLSPPPASPLRIFNLEHGYIICDEDHDEVNTAYNNKEAVLSGEPTQEAEGGETPEDPATKAGGGSSDGGLVFRVYKAKKCRPIVLYESQMAKLISQLPQAYQAYRRSDTSFVCDVVRGQKQRVALEVSVYQGKTYLFLKKYFKPMYSDGAEGYEASLSPWLPTRSVVGLDPDKDDPNAMLAFMTSFYPKY